MFDKYAVCFMTNWTNTVLYTGVTSDLEQRTWQHKTKAVKGFTEKYNVKKLVYYEMYGSIEEAIKREKQIKRWGRAKKDFLVNKVNPEWRDLSEDWYRPDPSTSPGFQPGVARDNISKKGEGPSTTLRSARDDALKKGVIWHPYTQHAIAGPAVEIERAQGAYLYARDGRKIIDAISSWWVNTHGHNHPKIVRAVQAQAEKLDQVIFAGFTHAPAEELAERLLRAAGGHFSHVFFSDSGSTAVEAALKMAIGYWVHTGRPRRKIAALEHGYHGDTFGAMAAGGRGIFSKIYEPYLFEVERLPFDDMEGAFEKLLKKEGGNVAALILEPLVLGAAGMKTYPPETLKNLSDLCAAQGVLLIADEVMTGFGRTGTMFACQQAGIRPDIMCLSKGLTGGFLPMGATLCRREIYDAFYSPDRGRMFFHSSSYTGNPMACAAALAALEIWESEPVMERIENISKAHAKAVKRFKRREDVADVRHRGTVLALDVIPSEGRSPKPRDLRHNQTESDPSTTPAFATLRRGSAQDDDNYLSALAPKFYKFFMAQDVLLRPIGNTVYILPPYCIDNEDLERIYDVIERALDSLRDEGKQQAA